MGKLKKKNWETRNQNHNCTWLFIWWLLTKYSIFCVDLKYKMTTTMGQIWYRTPSGIYLKSILFQNHWTLIKYSLYGELLLLVVLFFNIDWKFKRASIVRPSFSIGLYQKRNIYFFSETINFVEPTGEPLVSISLDWNRHTGFFIQQNTVKPVVTSIKKSPVFKVYLFLSCHRKFIMNWTLLRGHLPYKATFTLSQWWPLMTVFA
jgi:hypothetical protein